VSLELCRHHLDNVGRHGKAYPNVAAGKRNDGGIDANELALGFDQRSARVAAVDRRIGFG
jgi:hypothetical protein